ncbi:hypothetical protein NLY43_21975 [Mesorhizobium sp. C416B]|uniref:hypothetical protein n=1 Tax=unclassified Mesorhizobium TaxID=325217 RepID=UPI001FD9077A|nr:MULTISPECIES: hypothetical protein [unclassified Mesorhizobium]WJI61275.1 hypothetical protein NLY43_21975 [Mesorhizobium sp. C416B]
MPGAAALMGGVVAGQLSRWTQASADLHRLFARRRPRRPIEGFAKCLRAIGTEVTLFDGNAYTHMSINHDFGEDGDALTAAMLAFLNGPSVDRRIPARRPGSDQKPRRDIADPAPTGAIVPELSIGKENHEWRRSAVRRAPGQ